jgi:hypothetical protein
MKALSWTFATVIALTGFSPAQSAQKKDAPAKEKLIGAWHLAHIDAPVARWKTHRDPAAELT